MMRRKDGSLDPRWHGQWMVDGKRKHASLNLWRGTPPGPGEKEGDAKFERSRGEAAATLKRMKEGEKSKAEETILTKKNTPRPLRNQVAAREAFGTGDAVG